MEGFSRPTAERAAAGGTPIGRRRRQRIVLLEEAVAAYSVALQASAVPEATRRTYAAGLKLLVAYAQQTGKAALKDLSVALVRGTMVAAMDPRVPHQHNWKGGEVIAAIVAASSRGLARWLVDQGVPNVEDLSRVKLPKSPERIQPRVQANEFQLIEAAICRRLLMPSGSRLQPRWIVMRDLALVNLMADSALRAAELCALDTDDLDLENGTVTVQQGKGRKPRVLSIEDSDPLERHGGPALKALRDYMVLRCTLPGVALWIGNKHQRLTTSSLRRIILGWCQEAGLEGNRPPHTFRRGWFTDAYHGDPRNLPVLTKRMGWSAASKDLIRRYTSGADMDWARTELQPSMSNQWRRTKPPPRQTQKPSTGNLTGNPTRATESRTDDYGQFNRKG